MQRGLELLTGAWHTQVPDAPGERHELRAEGDFGAVAADDFRSAFREQGKNGAWIYRINTRIILICDVGFVTSSAIICHP